MTVQNQDKGYSTANFNTATALLVASTSLVSVDTGNNGGAAAATVALPLGLISQANKTATGITAHAGGTKAAAFQLDYGVSNVSVVGTNADSVLLPPALAGTWCFIKNSDSAQSVTVYGGGTSTIDGVASATGNAQAAGLGKLFFCVSGTGDDVAGEWMSLIGA